MNLQHAVQHLPNISLVRLHTNKPGETHTLTPTWLISTSSLPVQSEPRAERTCLFTLVDIRNAVIIFASTQSACAQMCFCCTNNRVIISYFPEKGGVQIIKFYGIHSKVQLITCLDSLLCKIRQYSMQLTQDMNTATAKVRCFNAKHRERICSCFQEEYYKVCIARLLYMKCEDSHNWACVVSN